jgi:hypothetical protein
MLHQRPQAGCRIIIKSMLAKHYGMIKAPIEWRSAMLRVYFCRIQLVAYNGNAHIYAGIDTLLE